MAAFLERYRRIIYVALVLLTVAALYALYVRAPREEPIEIVTAETTLPTTTVLPTATAETVTVHVIGAVQNPGVYTLVGHGRVIDVVDAAGGLTEAADTEMINLADRVYDGQQVRVPALGEQPVPTLTPYAGSTDTRSGAGLDLGTQATVNINTATAAELETLPGIGPVLAERVVAYRTEHGPFAAIEDIIDVSGIGDSIFSQIRDRITVQ